MTSVTLIHPSPPVFFGIDNKENLNKWTLIAVVLNILWSLFLIKLEPDINPNPSHGNEDLFRGSKKKSESLIQG